MVPDGDAGHYPFPGLPITPAPPFSWRQSLAALSGFGAVPDRGRPAGSTDGSEGGWQLALRLDGGRLVAVRLEAAPGEGPLAPDLILHVTDEGGGFADHLTLGEADSIWRQLDQFLALSLELDPLVRAARTDPAFCPVERALHGFHPPRFRSAFQAACWTVVRQRTPQAFAVATMARLTQLLGDLLPGADGVPLTLFPPPQRMAHGARAELLAATNNVRKVERLEGVAAAFARVDETQLRDADAADLLAWLRSLPGLGPWSAEQVLWRGVGRVERAAWRDTGALSAISQVYAPGLTLGRGTATGLARQYGQLQGVWLAYLKAYPRALSGQQPAAPQSDC